MGKRTDGKAEVGRVREEKRREDQRRESQKKEGKPRNIVFFQWFVAPEGRKVGSPKQRVRSHLARWEMKNCTRYGTKHMWKSKCRKHLTFGPLLEVEMSKKCTPVWREAHFQVKMYKARHSRSTFGSWHVEKVHAIVARSTCPSQNVKKHHMFGPLLDVQMSFCVAGARDQKVKALWQFQKRWQPWHISRGSAKIHFPWQAQCKRHVHLRC